jgi:hypothetical protein
MIQESQRLSLPVVLRWDDETLLRQMCSTITEKGASSARDMAMCLSERREFRNRSWLASSPRKVEKAAAGTWTCACRMRCCAALQSKAISYLNPNFDVKPASVYE